MPFRVFHIALNEEKEEEIRVWQHECAEGRVKGRREVLYKDRKSERKWLFYPSRREEATSSLYFENHFWEYEHL